MKSLPIKYVAAAVSVFIFWLEAILAFNHLLSKEIYWASFNLTTMTIWACISFICINSIFGYYRYEFLKKCHSLLSEIKDKEKCQLPTKD